MANDTKTVDTVINLIPPPAGTYFQVAMKVFNFANGWGRTDPIQTALEYLQNEIIKLQVHLAQINLRVNELTRRIVHLENNSRMNRLQEFTSDISTLQFELSQMPTDDQDRGLIAHKAGAIADAFITDFNLWQWTDLEIISRFDDYNQPLDPILTPLQADFKSYPALPVYLSALMTWLTAIDLHTGGNYERVKQLYGQKLKTHLAKISVTENWDELNGVPDTFPEHIMKRITCYPQEHHEYARNGECSFSVSCNNMMDREITHVDGSDFVIQMPTGNLCVADPNLGFQYEKIIEDERGVQALREVAELIERIEMTGTLRQQYVGQFNNTPAYNVSFIYVVKANGELLWRKQQPSVRQGELAGWSGPKVVGVGWNSVLAIYPAGGNLFYALWPDGTLYWYQHEGFNEGIFTWSEIKKVGWGWNSFATLFSGSDGVLYAVTNDGKLIWYKHDGYRYGGDVSTWRSSVLNQTSGWNKFKTIFSCGSGIIYAIANNGDMFWYRHKGFENGADLWDGGILVGYGWQHFSHVFSVGEGVIYAINPDGTVFWYKHSLWNLADTIINGNWPLFVGPDRQDYVRDVQEYMQRNWEGPLPAGTGWTGFQHIFPLLPSTPDSVR